MKGSIIEASDSDVYLCIGSKDGYTVDQELDVYKVIGGIQEQGNFQTSTYWEGEDH